MRILWFNWRDIKNPDAGGAEVYTHQIAKRLVKMGHDVTLFTSKFKGCAREEFVDGVRIVREGGKYTVYQKAKDFYKKYVNEFELVVDEINTRPFHTPSFARCSVLALIHQLAREYWFFETPFPVNVLGYHLLEIEWLKPYRGIPTVTVSNSTKRDLRALGFENVFVVHVGLNVNPVSRIPEKDESPTVIFIGRMKRAKRPQDVLEAFKIVKRDVKDAQLWMVGDGYLRGRLESKYGCKSVKFFGYVDSFTRDRLVKRAWVIAVPGIREGWGLVVTDANALGTPAVGYNIPGLRDSIKNGYTGFLVDRNPKAMAEGLITVLTDDRLRRRLSKNAISWARNFSWDKSAECFERIMGDVA